MDIQMQLHVNSPSKPSFIGNKYTPGVRIQPPSPDLFTPYSLVDIPELLTHLAKLHAQVLRNAM